MDRGAWWATVHKVTKSRTWLKLLSKHSQQISAKKLLDFPSSSDGKESACNAGDSDSNPGEGNGYPPQYSCLENSKDRGASRAIDHVNQELEMTEQLVCTVHARARAHTHTHTLDIPFPSHQKYMGEGLKVFGGFFFFFSIIFLVWFIGEWLKVCTAYMSKSRIAENRQSRKETGRGERWEKHFIIYEKMSNGLHFLWWKMHWLLILH